MTLTNHAFGTTLNSAKAKIMRGVVVSARLRPDVFHLIAEILAAHPAPHRLITISEAQDKFKLSADDTHQQTARETRAALRPLGLDIVASTAGWCMVEIAPRHEPTAKAWHTTKKAANRRAAPQGAEAAA